MTNTVTQVRHDLVAVLTEAGIQADHFLPERPNPPLALVVPGSTWLQRGDTFGSHSIGLDVLMLTATGTNAVQSDALDDMAARLTVAVFEADGFVLRSIDAPNAFQVNTAQYLGALAHVTANRCVEVEG